MTSASRREIIEASKETANSPREVYKAERKLDWTSAVTAYSALYSVYPSDVLVRLSNQ